MSYKDEFLGEFLYPHELCSKIIMGKRNLVMNEIKESEDSVKLLWEGEDPKDDKIEVCY